MRWEFVEAGETSESEVEHISSSLAAKDPVLIEYTMEEWQQYQDRMREISEKLGENENADSENPCFKSGWTRGALLKDLGLPVVA